MKINPVFFILWFVIGLIVIIWASIEIYERIELRNHGIETVAIIERMYRSNSRYTDSYTVVLFVFDGESRLVRSYDINPDSAWEVGDEIIIYVSPRTHLNVVAQTDIDQFMLFETAALISGSLILIYLVIILYRNSNANKRRQLEKAERRRHITELHPKRSKYFSAGYIISLTVISLALYIYFFNHGGFVIGWQIFTGIIIFVLICSSCAWVLALINERLYIYDDHFIYRDIGRDLWNAPYSSITKSLFQITDDVKPFIETDMKEDDDRGFYDISGFRDIVNLERAIEKYKSWRGFN